MVTMRLFALAIIFALSVLSPASRAASTTNFSDQWWNPNESGWGASFLQQADIIFIDLFVYGSDRSPIWYTVAAGFQGANGAGEPVFSGDLYLNNGPYFGGAFNSANVSNRKVGTLVFRATSVETGELTYSVDGVTVIKSVSRQLWRYENFTGSYYGGLVYDASQCSDAPSNGHFEELGAINISHQANNSVTLFTQTGGGSCTYHATYSQAGHMGTMQGTYSCTNGIAGSFLAYELEVSISGMTGRFSAQNNVCQSVVGRIGGVLR